jgi:hypothetical protein
MEITRTSQSAKQSPPENECYETTNKHSFALGVTADDGHEYFLGTAQFLDAELAANPAIENKDYAPPERLRLRYATGEVVILGRGLRLVARKIQSGELANLRPATNRYAGLQPRGPMISSIVVTRKESV